ncbi:amidohydrolase [Halomonas sp. I1]|uniref:amidohydrolase family protein n=1 Tax=Halomonas sp. I1 TaxID=393536 RepID=UPI0028DD4164|nr:amidohydrolase [Halomonas sp. I1]MDT8893108.1 amidohydrolase [Halomonas sp. I1]
MKADIAIVNGYVKTMDGGKALHDGIVLVKGNRILAVGTDDTLGDWEAGRVINAMGNVVMPGFSNCHTHIGSNVLLRGLNEDAKLFEWLGHMWKMKQNFDHETLLLASQVGLIEMLKAGITSFNEHFDAYSVTPEIDALETVPLRATLGFGFADRGLYADVNDYSWRALEDFGDKVEKYHGRYQGRLQVGLSPHATYSCGPELWRLCREVADAHGISIHTHLAEGMQELKYVGEHYGCTPTQWLASLGVLGPDVTAAHCTALNAEDIALMANLDVKVAHCPISNAKLCSGNMPMRELLSAGVHVGLATDGPASHNTLDMFQEMKFAAITHKNANIDPEILPLDRVLRMATRDAAIAMHRLDTGCLAEGMLADIIVVDIGTIHSAPAYSPEAALVYSCRADDVLYSIVDGQLLLDNKKPVGIEEEEVVIRLTEKACALRDKSFR